VSGQARKARGNLLAIFRDKLFRHFPSFFIVFYRFLSLFHRFPHRLPSFPSFRLSGLPPASPFRLFESRKSRKAARNPRRARGDEPGEKRLNPAIGAIYLRKKRDKPGEIAENAGAAAAKQAGVRAARLRFTAGKQGGPRRGSIRP